MTSALKAGPKANSRKPEKAHNPGWKGRRSTAGRHQSRDAAETPCYYPTVLLGFTEWQELYESLGKLVPYSQIFREGRLMEKMGSLEAT